MWGYPTTGEGSRMAGTATRSSPTRLLRRHRPADRPRDAILDRRPAADLRGRIPALHGVQGNDFPFSSKRAQRATDGIAAPALMIKLGEEGQLPPHLDL